MKANAIVTLILVPYIALGAAISVKAEESPIIAKFRELQQYDLETLSERVTKGTDADTKVYYKYRELGLHQYSASADGLSDEELTYLMRAAWTVATNAPQLGYHERLLEIFQELRRREALDDVHIRVMYQAWVRAREWDEAARLRRMFPSDSLLPLPEIRGSADSNVGQSILRLHERDFALVREGLKLKKGVSVIVGSSPGCAFVERAVSEIEDDPLLREFFSSRGHWLAAGPQYLLQFDAIKGWNQRFSAEMHIVDDLGEWPMLKHKLTPTFYVVSGDNEVETLRGWTPETQVRLRDIATDAVAYLTPPGS